LNAVTGLLELTLDTHITDTQKDYIVTALASADSLIRLINDILDFSKIEAHQVRIETRPFSLLDELNMAIRPFAIQAEAKGIIFECSRGPDLPVMVLGDSLRLRQILNNLLSNAIKFTDHGSIVLSVQRSLASAHETDWFDFRIQDSGIGIHPNQANRVFEAFTQADGSITRKYGGTGLGLTISRRLAELMGGQLTVQSQPGVGSAFLLHIPLHTSHPADALESPGHDVDSSIEASLMRGPKLNVLVADDDAINQRLVSARLNALGWKVTLVSNGRNAVDIIPSASFDLVMMDVNMPEMDGLTAARNIRTFETSFSRPPVPIIAMTAFVTDQDRANCMQAGMDDYLAKPVTRRDILSTIQRVLLRHRTPQAHPETLNTAPEGIPSMDPATLSRARALEITDGDSSLLVELTDVFLSDTPDLMQSLRRAVHDVQTNDVRHLAHKIKGMLGAIGADSGSAVAADLERAARHEQTGFYPEGLRRLESIMETLGRIMRTPEWRGTVNPPP
jgi:CheY-like chemotaxis protein/HPt (histidine-containing phosphotransfer) domain-containing protein